MDMKFKGNVILRGKIICDTGLHIGESNESLEIGGIDNMIMRDKQSNLPYIPGSSLKGKLRNLLELFNGDSVDNILKKGNPRNGFGPCNCGKCDVCKIFGFTNDKEGVYVGPTRLIVRDSFPDEETMEFWQNADDVSRGAELKTENVIDRVKGTAYNPRPSERVPKGSKFDFEFVFSIYKDEDKKNFKNIFTAMELLQDNYLGGSGSRGYGKIHFEDISYIVRDKSFYTESKEDAEPKTFDRLCDIPKDLELEL